MYILGVRVDLLAGIKSFWWRGVGEECPRFDTIWKLERGYKYLDFLSLPHLISCWYLRLAELNWKSLAKDSKGLQRDSVGKVYMVQLSGAKHMVEKCGEWVLKERQKKSSMFQMVLMKSFLMRPLAEILARLRDRRDGRVWNEKCK